MLFNPLNTNFTKWSNTLKQFVGKLQSYISGVGDLTPSIIKFSINKDNFQKILTMHT